MANQVFVNLIFISLSCSAVILVILLIRYSIGKRTGAWWRSIIWTVVLLRLMVPVVIQSPVGLLNTSYIESNTTEYDTSFLNKEQDSTEARSTAENCISVDTELKPIDPAISSINLIDTILIIYIIGLTISFALLVLRATALRHRLKMFKQCANNQVLHTLEIIKRQMKIRRNITVLVDDNGATPAIMGLIKPCLIITKKVEISDRCELKHILTHELMHYKQKDIIKLWLLEIAQCIHWFNPLMYIVKSTILQDFELACDERVLSQINGASHADYGSVIVSYSTSPSIQRRKISVNLSRGGKSLKERLLMIKRYSNKTNRIYGVFIVFCTIAALISCTTTAISANDISLDTALQTFETGDLPNSFDWRNEDVVLAPQNQKPYGAGAIFASVGIFESSIARTTGKQVCLSEQHYINSTDDWDSKMGVSPEKVFEFLVENGVTKDEILPYTGVKKSMPEQPRVIYMLHDWGSRLLANKGANERRDIIKLCLLEHGPVITNIRLFEGYLDYESGTYEYDSVSNEIGGHWVTIVGWVDDPININSGYWIVKESWGTDWGEGGYAKIAYNDECGIDDFIIYYVGEPVA